MADSPFQALFVPSSARWQQQALQHLVDYGQQFFYQRLEATFLNMWANLTPAGYRGLTGFFNYLHELVGQDATVSIHAVLDAANLWVATHIEEVGQQLASNLARGLAEIAGKSAQMFGEAALARFPKWADTRITSSLAFDAVNEDAVRWAEQRAGKLVVGVNRQVQQNIAMLTANAVAGNATPKQLAAQIYRFIPLQPQHTALLIKNVETMRAAGIPEAEVMRVMNSQAKRWLKYRANNIARTETIAANNYGVDSWIRQKHDAGLLPGTSLRVWIATRDDLTCPRCAPMHGKVSPIGGTWTGPGPRKGETVTLDFPPLHPSCRCAIAVVVPGLLTEQEREQIFAPV